MFMKNPFHHLDPDSEKSSFLSLSHSALDITPLVLAIIHQVLFMDIAPPSHIFIRFFGSLSVTFFKFHLS